MNKISANTVFHFTNLTALDGILRYGFFPRYSSEEYLTEKGSSFRAGIPMVCFCDIPLSQLGDHINQYGNYGIGLSKEWAIRNRLNPVLYVERSSILWHKFESVLERNYDGIKKLNELGVRIESLFQDRYSLTHMFMYTKPYDGFYYHNNVQTQKRFYNEREWRYIPDLERIGGDELLLDNSMLHDAIIEKKNKILQEYKLCFKLSDIRYLIIAQESERTEILTMITGLESLIYNDEEKKILSSKIISTEQIKNDI